MDLGEILAKGSLQNTSLDRRQRMAEALLSSGSRATNPLIAFLTGAVGTYQMGNIAQEQEEKEKKMAEAAANMPPSIFEGTSMDAQTYNILATGDPSSKAYEIAYKIAAQPKTQVAADGTIVTVKPDLSAFVKPAPKLDARGNAPIVPQEATAPQTVSLDGTEITTIQGNRPSSTDKSTLKEVKSGAETIKAELGKFAKAIDSASDADFASAAVGGVTEGGQKLTGLWTTTALSAKGKALLDLGVLNGPDLEVMQRMLPNPSSLTGGVSSKAAYKQAIKNVESFIDDRVKAYEAQYGAKPLAMPQMQPEIDATLPNPPVKDIPIPQGLVKRKKYNPATGRIE